jgi:hypothetical protein
MTAEGETIPVSVTVEHYLHNYTPSKRVLRHTFNFKVFMFLRAHLNQYTVVKEQQDKT